MMTPWSKKKPEPKPEVAVIALPEDLKAAVRAEAAAVMKIVGRAEAKAQATIKLKETVGKLEAMLARERADSNRKLSILADSLNRAMVIIEVLRDLAASDGAQLRTECNPKAKAAKINQLCTLKQIQMDAVGGRA